MLNGGIIGPVNPTSRSVAGGVWRLEEEYAAMKAGLWVDSLPVRTNLLSWYDVSDSSTVTLSSGKVSSLLDKSGNSRHATQSTAGQQPVYTANAVNGKPTLDFTSANSTVLNIANAVTHSAGTVHIFGVVKAKTMAINNNSGFYGSVGQTNALAYCFPGAVSANRQTLLHSGVSWFTASSVASFNTTNFYQLNTSWDGANVIYRQSRTADGTTVYGGRPANSSNALGAQESTSYSNIYLSELIVYSSPLSASDRDLVENYLFNKWGV